MGSPWFFVFVAANGPGRDGELSRLCHRNVTAQDYVLPAVLREPAMRVRDLLLLTTRALRSMAVAWIALCLAWAHVVQA